MREHAATTGTRAALAVAILWIAACGDPTHDDIATWQTTQKGPGKLRAALGNAKLDPDLRAHAAEALIGINEWVQVKDALEAMGDGPAKPVVAKLVPRLREQAAVPDGFRPSPAHIAAKDALFFVRAFADDGARNSIDEYLAEWVGQSFDNRQALGRVEGLTIVKHAGPRAAAGLLAAIRKNIAASPDAQGRVPLTSDELLKGLAYTGDPEAAGVLVGIGGRDHPEPTLRKRATGALYWAYVHDVEPPRPDPAALAPHVVQLAEIAKDPDSPGASINDSIALIAAAGQPACEEPMLELVRRPGSQRAFLWVAVREALACLGPAGAPKVVDAVPPGSYERGILDKYLWKKIVGFDNRAAVATSCLALLESTSPVSRVTGIECLGRVSNGSHASAVSALSKDSAVLRGWWGDQEDVPRRERKKDPTVGDVAQEVAKRLENK